LRHKVFLFSLQFPATLINFAQNGQFFTKIRHIR